MTTTNFGASPADFGLPSENELEILANGLFTDVDGSLFEPDVCADGIEKLVTTGNTEVFDTSAEKAERVFGGQLKAQDYENIIGELADDSVYNQLSGIAAEFSGVSGIEAGTGSIADAVGLGAALEYLNGIGMPEVSRYEHELVTYGMRELGKINGLHLIGTAANKSSARSFVMDGVSNDSVGQILDQNGIAVRVGHHCAQPIIRHYGYESVVRPTLAIYNTFEDIDTLAKVLKSI